MNIRPREPVVFAEDFVKLYKWYMNAFDLNVTLLEEEKYHYCHLENDQGFKIGIADAAEMGVKPQDRMNNSVVIQIQVEDLKEFFAHVENHEGCVNFGPSFDKSGGFWFGGIADIEGNPIWVVDQNCP
jgi:predicted enzyme related to lactoylglutathione lyase